MPLIHKDSARLRKSVSQQQHCCGPALGTVQISVYWQSPVVLEKASAAYSIDTSLSWEKPHLTCHFAFSEGPEGVG